MQKKWEIKSQILPTNITQTIQILANNRGIENTNLLQQNIRPEDFIASNEPFISMKGDFDKATELVRSTISSKFPIIIHGDYDADGQTATSILYRTIRNDLKYENVFYYIPNRFDEGYGLTIESVDGISTLLSDNQFSNQNALIITVDCGIVSYDEVEYAKKIGYKVIISDHHKPSEIFPKPNILLWTDQSTGAGIAWILSKTLLGESKYTELAAIGTICDLQPLIGFNRAIAKEGLMKINSTEIIGIRCLRETAGIDGNIEEYHVGWVIGPRLNATGRLENGADSVKLLITDDLAEARELATKLNSLNLSRQEKTRIDLDTAISDFKDLENLPSVLISYNKNYHEGVIGLVAGKLVQTYYRPAVAITSEGESEIAKGSARSIDGISIIETLRKYENLFERIGGHSMAAGFSIKVKNIEKLKSALALETSWDTNLFVPKIKIECELPSSLINLELYNEVQKLRPFGIGNPEPIFSTNHFRVVNLNFLGKENNHLKLFLSSDIGNNITALFFNARDNSYVGDLKIGDKIILAYNLSLNEWNGRTSLELRVKDLKFTNADNIV